MTETDVVRAKSNFKNLLTQKHAIKRNENSIEKREPYHDCNWAFGICLLIGGIVVTIGQHYRILDF